jgi:hypothetical protein
VGEPWSVTELPKAFVVFFSQSLNFLCTAFKHPQVKHACEPFYHYYCENTREGTDKHINYSHLLPFHPPHIAHSPLTRISSRGKRQVVLVHGKKAQTRSSRTATVVLSLGSRRKRWVKRTRPLYRRKASQYSLNRRLYDP